MKNNLSNNINIGVDIEDVGRFRSLKLSSDKTFLGKIFTERELAFCFSKKNSAEHLAGRFSAKESVIKALGAFGVPAIHFSEIEIKNDKKGLPKVTIGRSNLKSYDVKVSISHSKDKVLTAAIASLAI
ncbi:MAG TPA: holo-ACP synthase [Candidatus Paceibacterota bacterium]